MPLGKPDRFDFGSGAGCDEGKTAAASGAGTFSFTIAA
jgi:hypothetical protein